MYFFSFVKKDMTNETLIWIFHLKNLSFRGAERYNIALSQIRIVPLHAYCSVSKEKEQ